LNRICTDNGTGKPQVVSKILENDYEEESVRKMFSYPESKKV
jgi:hypothetical protein